MLLSTKQVSYTLYIHFSVSATSDVGRDDGLGSRRNPLGVFLHKALRVNKLLFFARSLRLVTTRTVSSDLLANVDFAVSWLLKSLNQQVTGTDPTTSIVGARRWLAGWRLSARRRRGSECILDYLE